MYHADDNETIKLVILIVIVIGKREKERERDREREAKVREITHPSLTDSWYKVVADPFHFIKVDVGFVQVVRLGKN